MSISHLDIEQKDKKNAKPKSKVISQGECNNEDQGRLSTATQNPPDQDHLWESLQNSQNIISELPTMTNHLAKVGPVQLESRTSCISYLV